MSSSAEIPIERIRLQVDRILQSDPFRESPTLQRLLTYIVSEAIEGRADGLKEYSIGTSAFQRGVDFDPRTDSIVRVQMGVLRKKLGLYYSGPGAGDEIVVEIPRGHYAPAFRMRSAEESAPAVPASTGPSRRLLLWLPTAIAAVAVFSVLGLYVFQTSPQATRSSDLKAAQWADHPVWKGFFTPGSQTKLVVGVPYMFSMGGMMVRNPGVNNAEELATDSSVKSFSKLVGPPRPCEVYTGLGEAAGINLLTRFFASASLDLTLIRSRLAKWQDLATGNAIFLSSARFRTLDEQIDRPVDFSFIHATHTGTSLAIHIRNPKPGERDEYASAINSSPDGQDDGTDYALISVWPGTLPGRRIITMGGIYTWGTEGAAEFLTDGPSLNELKGKLSAGAPAGRADHGLQIILRVTVKNNQVASTSYVTHHWLE
jgi:hypothetical protein